MPGIEVSQFRKNLLGDAWPMDFRKGNSDCAGSRMLTLNPLRTLRGELFERQPRRICQRVLPEKFPTLCRVERRRADFQQRMVNIENGRADFHESRDHSNGKRFCVSSLS